MTPLRLSPLLPPIAANLVAAWCAYLMWRTFGRW